MWFGATAADTASYERVRPFDTVLTCDFGLDVALLEKRVAVVSLERAVGMKKSWGSFHLDELAEGATSFDVEHILKLAGPEGADIMCYAASAALERTIDRIGVPCTLAAIKSSMRASLDDKLFVRQGVTKCGLDVIPGEVLQLADASYRHVRAKLGERLVVQLPVGSSGSHTFPVSSDAEYEGVANRHGGMAIVTPRLQGWSLNSHGVVSEGSITVGDASVQLIGIPECVDLPFGWCGNDFGAMRHLGSDVAYAVSDGTKRIGEWLRTYGYRGMFGVDMFVETHSNRTYVLEVNPRLQGSTSLLTQLELMWGKTPLVARHLAAFGLSGPALGAFGRTTTSAASQLIVCSQHEGEAVTTNAVRPGVYFLDDSESGFRWVREGTSLLDCREEEEYLITGVPLPGSRVLKHSALACIQTFRSVLDPAQPNRLFPWARDVVKTVRHALGVTATKPVGEHH